MLTFSRIFLPAMCVLLLGLGGCATTQTGGVKKVSREDAALVAGARAKHDVFRSVGHWRENTYRDEDLLKQATADNIAIEISIKEQRGFLLVKNAIAMDFPVATGKSSHPTPTGTFHVMEKELEYHSNLYGKITDATGVVLVAEANSRTDVVPEGAKFEGATMPFFMRLTDDGVGMHIGYVPGVPASHGCIRLRKQTATTLFGLVKVGTPVTIAENAPCLATVK